MYPVAAVLFVLWVLGVVCHCMMGGTIHILLIAAIIMVLVKFNSNQKQGARYKQQARARQSGRDLQTPKTWVLK